MSEAAFIPGALDYDLAIAGAAREFIKARFEHNLERSQKTALPYERSLSKLCWMVEAEKHKWNPASYEPEF